jgi:hypothetical protein
MPLGYAPKIGEVLAYYGLEREDVATAIFKYGSERRVTVTNEPASLGGTKGQQGFSDPSDLVLMAKKLLEGNDNTVPKKYPGFHGTIAKYAKDFNTKSQKGADVVIDIDVKDNFREAFKQGRKILNFLDYYNVPFRMKFSGGSGPHFIIPYEWFPKSLLNGNFSKTHQLVFQTIVSRSRAGNVDGSFMSQGHFYRMPYSLNEHTGLVSLPLTKEQYDDFTLSMAQIWNTQVNETWFQEPDESSKEALNDMIRDIHGKKGR